MKKEDKNSNDSTPPEVDHPCEQCGSKKNVSYCIEPYE